ncbi:Hypothetical protein NTJ_04168 [Nesidiocoris tenuis]|uniref:Uncharacterized protein n=1 Tax=Nesidiocoris tenuis TaxID=355587 RepID=A0ABN7AGG9_9HEMI|nr:Hypothetical protein NTJ_04168 [Nesidiocoris tenuis]
MFLQTLGIKKWTVRYWICGDSFPGCLEDLDETTATGMAQNKSITKPSRKLKRKKDFLDMLPKLPSNYCRQTSSRQYLEPIIPNLYRLYVDHCKKSKKKESSGKNQELPLSSSGFRRIYDSMNIPLYQPKKDKCDTCCEFELGKITNDVYCKHVVLKNNARAEKSRDKEEAIAGRIHAFTSDLQAVRLSPCLSASTLYYKTKLNVHNFTMYNLATRGVVCYWFDESCTNVRKTLHRFVASSKVR